MKFTTYISLFINDSNELTFSYLDNSDYVQKTIKKEIVIPCKEGVDNRKLIHLMRDIQGIQRAYCEESESFRDYTTINALIFILLEIFKEKLFEVSFQQIYNSFFIASLESNKRPLKMHNIIAYDDVNSESFFLFNEEMRDFCELHFDMYI